MSRQNKVNPDHYKVAGRLSTDDLARERKNQGASQLADLRRRPAKAMPPWMTREEPARGDESLHEDQPQANARRSSASKRVPVAKATPAATSARGRKPRRSTTARPASASVKVQVKAKAKAKAKTMAKAKASKTTKRKAAKTTARKTATKRSAKPRAR